MDHISREKLDEILAKEPAALTEGDIAFLKARESYLKPHERAVYADVLDSQPEGQDDAAESNIDGSDEPQAKKTSKAKKTEEASE